jgi:hypothetical protein
MKKSTDILNTITTEFELFKAEAEKYDQKNNKAAARRARKKSLYLSKLFKEYRQATLKEEKEGKMK